MANSLGFPPVYRNVDNFAEAQPPIRRNQINFYNGIMKGVRVLNCGLIVMGKVGLLAGSIVCLGSSVFKFGGDDLPRSSFDIAALSAVIIVTGKYLNRKLDADVQRFLHSLQRN